MKIETIKERIEKSKEKIIKLNKTLERHNLQLAKKSKALTDKGINLEKYDKYDKDVIDHDTYWDLCDYEHKLDDIKNTTKKIQEASKTLEGLQKQLDDQLAKDEKTNNMIPEVLNVFLENWKQKCITYYTALADEYIKLISKNYKEINITKEELEELQTRKYDSKAHEYVYVQKYTDKEIEAILNNSISEYELDSIKSSIQRRHISKFRHSRFASDIGVIDRIIDDYTINNSKLNAILDYDVKVKKEMFIERIKQVIGDIKDLSGLKISANGEINGIAKGVKCNAKVETIGAGGYNIQCYHFRVLVNLVRN